MLVNKFAELGLDVTVLADNEIPDEDMEPRKIDHDKDPISFKTSQPSALQEHSWKKRFCCARNYKRNIQGHLE